MVVSGGLNHFRSFKRKLLQVAKAEGADLFRASQKSWGFTVIFCWSRQATRPLRFKDRKENETRSPVGKNCQPLEFTTTLTIFYLRSRRLWMFACPLPKTLNSKLLEAGFMSDSPQLPFPGTQLSPLHTVDP